MSQITFSVIVPVYNRPNEVDELLASLCKQTSKNFEVIIVEDGSSVKSDEIVKKYANDIDIKYFFKENEGPGLTRNYGANLASKEWLVFFDSDCIIPEKYFENVSKSLLADPVDAYGGPDMAHPLFTPVQKAINYSMTSFFTTGGIRGGNKSMDKFYPRSFNMGYSRKVYEVTKGFGEMRFGEDIDMSYRIIQNGFGTRLIPEAAVYHKRRTDFRKFFKQVFNSGVARINLSLRHPGTFKLVHLFPAVFVLFQVAVIAASVVFTPLVLLAFAFISLVYFTDSLLKNKSFKVALLSIISSFGQMNGYGTGFLLSFWRRIILKKPEFHAFKKNFYK